MNRVQVIEEVIRLRDEREKDLDEKIHDTKLSKGEHKKFKNQQRSILKSFTNEPMFKQQNFETWKAWSDTKHDYDPNEYWHQFVRACFQIEKLKFMTVRTFRLFREFEVPRDTSFKLEFGDRVTNFPDEVSKLIWIEDLFSDYVRILKDAKLKLSFDTEERKTDELKIRGRINWKETLRKSPGRPPTSFETMWRQKMFATPENILLVACAVWLNEQAKYMLVKSEKDLLSTESHVLAKIILETTKICRTFPFHDVVDKALKYKSKLNSHAALSLEKMVKKRQGSGLIDNKAYGRLLKWFEDFKKKTIASPEDSPQKSLVLLAMQHIDTLYEFWIFLEILKHMSKRSTSKIKTKLTKSNKNGIEISRLTFDYFETSINDRTVRFHFGKEFFKEEDSIWAGQNLAPGKTWVQPDISVTVDGKVVGAFDAKNHEQDKTQKTGGEEGMAALTRTMLGYMMNLQAPMGALFFPHWSGRFKPKEGKGVLGFSMPISASWIQMRPAPDAESEKINSDSLGFLEEELSKFVAMV